MIEKASIKLSRIAAIRIEEISRTAAFSIKNIGERCLFMMKMMSKMHKARCDNMFETISSTALESVEALSCSAEEHAMRLVKEASLYMGAYILAEEIILEEDRAKAENTLSHAYAKALKDIHDAVEAVKLSILQAKHDAYKEPI